MNTHTFRVAVGVALLAGCMAPVLAQQYPAGPAGAYDTGPDPAAANLAPINQSPQPPPALPVYVQPPAPADGYMWVPGYWAFNRLGYYWVPGAWVLAPYTGALWTPGYWGYANGFYLWNAGYWGPHVGYYGGINYGFGYIGVGYVGGYWNHDRFYYNRSVTNVNVTRVTNVYDHRVVYDNHGPGRVSYHGGPNGIQRGPDPREMAARGERHMPPTDMQRQYSNQAGTNQGQFFNHNQGRPTQAVVDHPVGGSVSNPRPSSGSMPPQGGANPGFGTGGQGRPSGSGRPDQPTSMPTSASQAAPNRNGGNSMPPSRPAQPAQPAQPTPQQRPTFNSGQIATPSRPQQAASPSGGQSSSRQERPSFEQQPSHQGRPQQNAAPSHPQQQPQQRPEQRADHGGGSRERDAGNKGEGHQDRGGNNHN